MTTRFSFGRKLGYDIRSQLSVIPASFVRFESFQSHDVRSQMEFAASKDETQKLIDNHPSSPYLTWISTIENTTDQDIAIESAKATFNAMEECFIQAKTAQV